jgi:hypothetical protein
MSSKTLFRIILILMLIPVSITLLAKSSLSGDYENEPEVIPANPRIDRDAWLWDEQAIIRKIEQDKRAYYELHPIPKPE